MPLDPTIQMLVDQMRQADRRPMSEGSVEAAREAYLMLSAISGAPADLASITDIEVPGPSGSIPVRVYTPEAEEGPLPLVVYLHGGGFTIGSIETHDLPCQQLSDRSGCIVASVDYRLAPEHPFPAAIDDSWAATAWLAAHAGELGADPKALAVAGDSAGGNLAAVVTHLAADAGSPHIAFQLLIYPAVDARMSYPSIKENGDIPFLSEDSMQWFWTNYSGGQDIALDPKASPLERTDLSGLPPAMVITAEFDALRDEGEAYAERLAAAGVQTDQRRYGGMPHAFFQMGGLVEPARLAMADAAEALRRALRA